MATPLAKRWWMAELMRLRCKYAKCSRVEFSARGTESWSRAKQECAAAHNTYDSTLGWAKATHWKDWLEGITEQDIWKAAQFAQNLLSDGSRTCIPTLYTKSASNETVATHETPLQKAAVLQETQCTLFLKVSWLGSCLHCSYFAGIQVPGWPSSLWTTRL